VIYNGDSIPIFDPDVYISNDPNLTSIAFKWSYIYYQMVLEAWCQVYELEKEEVTNYWMEMCRP